MLILFGGFRFVVNRTYLTHSYFLHPRKSQWKTIFTTKIMILMD